MNKSYVLWVENEPEKLKNFQRDIEDDDEIELIIKRDAKSAVQYLEDNIEKLSAAVLDVESFPDSSSTEEMKSSFSKVRDQIIRLEHRNKIEYFAFTGKAKYLKDEEDFEGCNNCKVFSKQSQTIDAEKYLRDIVKRHVIANISHRYGEAFSVINEYEAKTHLLAALLIVENNDVRNVDAYTRIRKVLEWVMLYCYDIGISQIVFIGTNLAECSRFMGQSEMTSLVPMYIQRSMFSAVSVANEGSHLLPNERKNRETIDQDTLAGKCPYLIRSTVFELLNILKWLSSLATSEEAVIERKSQTLEILNAMNANARLTGPIEVDEKGNYHCSNCLLLRKSASGLLGRTISITKTSPNTSDSKELYPLFSSFFDIVDE